MMNTIRVEDSKALADLDPDVIRRAALIVTRSGKVLKSRNGEQS